MSFGVIIAVGLAYISLNNSMEKLSKKIDRLDEKVDLLLELNGVELPGENYLDEDLKKDILMLLKEGKKIKAVKALRDRTGMDLIDAKEKIDGIEKELD